MFCKWAETGCFMFRQSIEHSPEGVFLPMVGGLLFLRLPMRPLGIDALGVLTRTTTVQLVAEYFVSHLSSL